MLHYSHILLRDTHFGLKVRTTTSDTSTKLAVQAIHSYYPNNAQMYVIIDDK